MITPVWSTFSY